MFKINYCNSSFEDEVQNLRQNMGYNPSDVYVLIPGEQCVSKVEFYQTLKDTLNFPEYFSFNWDSCSDCIFDFIMRSEGNIFIFFSNMSLLLSEDEDDRGIFMGILDDLSQNEYSKEVNITFSS